MTSDGTSGESLWDTATDGSIAASPMLAGDAVVVGGFDGFVRSYAQADGALRWEFGAQRCEPPFLTLRGIAAASIGSTLAARGSPAQQGDLGSWLSVYQSVVHSHTFPVMS